LGRMAIRMAAYLSKTMMRSCNQKNKRLAVVTSL
jgi:hypothetical protein